jgi:hypothetical protein
VVGNASRLLHVVRDDHDRVALAQFVDQLFDAGRGDRIQRAAGLIHEQYLWL